MELDINLILKLLLATGLWTLIWLERWIWKSFENWKNPDDIRTFSIVAFLWAFTTLISSYLNSSIFVVLSLFLIWVFISIYYYYALFKENKTGITTELSFLVTFFLWVFVMLWDYKIAIILSIIITFLLSSKSFFLKLTEKISIIELHNSLKFAVISLVVLPMLPNQKYSIMDMLWFLGYSWTSENKILNLDFFNPYWIWFFVVLMSWISYAGYMMSKFVWEKSSIIASWAIWWLVSSTAVTASMTANSKKDEINTDLYVVSTLLANTIMFVRVVVIVLLFNINMISSILLPSILMLLWMLSYMIFFYFKWRKKTNLQNIISEKKEYKSPFSIGPALKFALFVLMIKFISWVWSLYKDVWWDYFYYALWIISGLADVDAISQTMSVDSRDWKIAIFVASITIIIAIISNNFVKWWLALSWNKRFWFSVMMWFVISTIMWLIWLFIVWIF